MYSARVRKIANCIAMFALNPRSIDIISGSLLNNSEFNGKIDGGFFLVYLKFRSYSGLCYVDFLWKIIGSKI